MFQVHTGEGQAAVKTDQTAEVAKPQEPTQEEIDRENLQILWDESSR